MSDISDMPKFGIKKYEMVDATFYHDSGHGGESNPARKLLRVEFLNGRVYHSYFDEYSPCSVLYSNLHGDSCPLEEQNMEFLVVEWLCHVMLDPHFNKRIK